MQKAYLYKVYHMHYIFFINELIVYMITTWLNFKSTATNFHHAIKSVQHQRHWYHWAIHEDNVGLGTPGYVTPHSHQNITSISHSLTHTTYIQTHQLHLKEIHTTYIQAYPMANYILVTLSHPYPAGNCIPMANTHTLPTRHTQKKNSHAPYTQTYPIDNLSGLL